MELKILNLTDTQAHFEISGADHTFVNSLRRTLIADVPKMAIDEVDFHLGHLGTEEDPETHKLVDYESLSPLFDEIIAHRLGMLPIPTDLKAFTFSEYCSCGGEGCPSCTVMYSLNKKGPCTIYGADLEPVMGDESMKVIDPRIPIVTLGPREGLLLYARAKLGQGRYHAKWQVCSGVGYTHCSTVTLKNHASLKPLFEHFEEEQFTKKGSQLWLEDPVQVEAFLKVLKRFPSDAELHDYVTVEEDPNRFLLRFETDGSLSAQEAFLYALKVLAGRFEAFQREVRGLTAQGAADGRDGGAAEEADAGESAGAEA